MMRIFDFLDRTISAVDELLEDRIANHLQTKPITSVVRSCSKINRYIEQPRDTVTILDISGSMFNSDYAPTRLDGGILAAIEYVKARAAQCSQDQIAVITFNEGARTVLPLIPIDEKVRIVAALEKLKAGGGTDIAKGLQAAIRIFDEEPVSDRQRHIILLTDGHGGNPIRKAAKLKERYGAVISVVGIGGVLKAVNESLLRKVATTDPDGFNHYCFIKDSAALKQHYHQLATSLVWRGKEK